MFIIVPILLIVFGIIFVTLIAKDVFWDHTTIEIGCFILAAIFFVTSIFFVINAVICLNIHANADAYYAEKTELRNSYIALLERYDALADQDLTASSIYMDLYNKIINFNLNVRQAQNNKNRAFWAEGLLYNPAYLNLEPIPIN